MEFITKEERRRIFRKELYTLKELEYVTSAQYKDITEAHNDYFADLLAKEHLEMETHQNSHATDTNVVQPSQDTVPKSFSSKPKSVRVKLQKTAEEIRERNISWSLNLGVIMLLIGGLFVATSNWETMTPIMKSGSIALVSMLFYTIALISYRILKIEKTAFAFVVLGSLFLPIFTLSVGWFELLGQYLSFNGQGRFILGAISSSIVIPIYALLAKKLISRLFVWFSFIASTASIAYTLRAIGLETDGFYLGLMLYNTLLIAGYHYFKKKNLLLLFTKELALYFQANMVLSTLFMLLLFENQLFYGFNLILTAVIYLSMIYVTERKEYHFVFSAMFVYGAYRILETADFHEGSIIGYALLGFVFLLLPMLVSDQFALKKAFHWTSAVVSGLAFLMITVEGMMLRSQAPSLTLFAAYLLIAANFIYLANINSKFIFRYLSPIFLASAFYEAILQLDSWFEFETLVLPIYFIGFGLFTLFGWRVKAKYLKVIKTSSRDIGIVIMLLISLVAFAMVNWWELAIMLFLSACLFYLLIKIDSRPFMQLSALWIAPLSFGLSAFSLGTELGDQSKPYQNFLGNAGNFAVAAVLLLAVSFFFKKRKEGELANSTFFISHGFYAWALVFTFLEPITSSIGESIIWFGGIAMSFLLYKTTKDILLTFMTGVIILAWYLLTMDSINGGLIHFKNSAETFILPGGAWLLLASAAMILKKDRMLAGGIAWVAHVYMAPVLLSALITYGELAMWTYLVATLIYSANVFFVNREWKVKVLLYSAFTTLFLMVKTGIIHFSGEDIQYYAFLSSSIVIGAFWLLATHQFKQRAAYYLVPFSLMGVASFIAAYPYGWMLYGFTLLYAAGLLIFLHRVKWDLYALLPLLMVFYATIQIILLARTDVFYDIALLAGCGILLLTLGKILYPTLWERGGILGIKKLDAYTIVSFAFLISISQFKPETFWAQIIHGMLVSAALWLQHSRVNGDAKLIVRCMAGVYLIVPYYAVVEQLDLPALWQREVYVLPFVAVAIFLRMIAKERWNAATGYIQWAVLILVSLVLVQDGLASNTVYDALILGSLSLTAMVAGMWLRVKAYFFVGAGVLLLNVVMQTRQYWGSLPWWGYLLIGGSILISIASFNEWNKQKVAKGEKSFIMKKIEKITARLKSWN